MSKQTDRLNRFFSANGPFMDHLSVLVDFLLLGMLWLVFSLPVITLGASSAALSCVSFRILEGEGTGVLKPFLSAFCRYFRKATGLWILLALLGGFFIMDLYFYFLWTATGRMMGTILFGLFAAAFLIYLCVMCYVFPYVSHFHADNKKVVRNCFYLAFRHIGYTIIILTSTALMIGLSFLSAIVLIIAPGVAALIRHICLRKVFSGYLPKLQDSGRDTE